MASQARKSPFDPQVFLATIDGGRTVSNYPKGGIVFAQGSPADAVFFIQKGKIKIAVTSDPGLRGLHGRSRLPLLEPPGTRP